MERGQDKRERVLLANQRAMIRPASKEIEIARFLDRMRDVQTFLRARVYELSPARQFIVRRGGAVSDEASSSALPGMSHTP